jgi:mannose-6-phosphate isomerase-like protein (cupin superfamily)
VVVTDLEGSPIGGVKVSVEGPAARSATTEAGRIAFEDLPLGNYRLRFEREGFNTLERELTARGGAPMQIKVALSPAPKPPPPPPPPPPPGPVQTVAPRPLDVDPVAVDLPAFIEKNYIGRGAGKMSPLACSTGAGAALLQVRDPIAEHTHAEADEFLYVIAGEGSARVNGHELRLHAGVFMMVPRGVAHTLASAGKGPLELLSMRAGEACK